jgi:hypothetical protein
VDGHGCHMKTESLVSTLKKVDWSFLQLLSDIDLRLQEESFDAHAQLRMES